jgi:hypothetical protein
MNVTLQQLNRWLSQSSEHPQLELKQAKTQFDFK